MCLQKPCQPCQCHCYRVFAGGTVGAVSLHFPAQAPSAALRGSTQTTSAVRKGNLWCTTVQVLFCCLFV